MTKNFNNVAWIVVLIASVISRPRSMCWLIALRDMQGGAPTYADLSDASCAHAQQQLQELSVEERMGMLGLRYFTPRELANFHSFPDSFSFPDSVTIKQCYACLGNSLSVLVVAELLAHLLRGHRAAATSQADRAARVV